MTSSGRSYTAAIGPEPLDDDFSVERFAAALRGSRQAIKKVIMDQRHLAGVGNIYANEALFAAGIDPSKPARLLTPEDQQRLHAEIRRILTRGDRLERNDRSGLQRPAPEKKGNFQLELLVYGRRGRALPRLRHAAHRNPRDRRADHGVLPPLPEVSRGRRAQRVVPLPSTDLDQLRRRVRALAENRPAVYQMFDATGRVLYVGKAKRLRTRLLTYFRASYPDDKAARILYAASEIRWDYVPSEFAAYLGELRQIRKLRPYFNHKGNTTRRSVLIKIAGVPPRGCTAAARWRGRTSAVTARSGRWRERWKRYAR